MSGEDVALGSSFTFSAILIRISSSLTGGDCVTAWTSIKEGVRVAVLVCEQPRPTYRAKDQKGGVVPERGGADALQKQAKHHSNKNCDPQIATLAWSLEEHGVISASFS